MMQNLVLPGDLTSVDVLQNQQISVGPGIYCDPITQELKVVEAGMEHINETKRGKAVYVDYNSKRYNPSVGDLVVGVITGSFGDSYRVSLSNFSGPVSLSYMAFPNATKKNRPTLKVGDLCYARVCTADKELEAEIECIDSTSGKDAGFGLLDGGMVVQVSLAFSRELLFNDNYPLLSMIGSMAEFEVAIGVNGTIWIKTVDVITTLACLRCIRECEKIPTGQFKAKIREIFKQLSQSAEDDAS